MISIKDIDSGKGFDWGRTSQDYAKFRDIYPDAFFEKLIAMGLGTKGQRVLDLGTGTGVLPRHMAKYGASFVGADISENQIAYARQLTQTAGLDIEYVVSSAETLDFPEKSFDVITACQCFLYFNTATAIPRIHRLLKDGGHFAVIYMVWLPFEDEIARKSEETVLRANPAWTGAGLKRYSLDEPDWLNGLFEVDGAVTYDIPVRFTRESWHGRMKACRGIGASLSPEQIADWEREHLAYLATVPESFDILHFVSVQTFKKI